MTLTIITRNQWGAQPPKNPPRSIPIPSAELWLHHTASSDGEAPRVRAIQRYHQVTKGWNDIAYNFLISGSGTIYEGVGAGILGTHTKGHNWSSHAICVLGNYNVAEPTVASLDAVVALIRHGHLEGWWPDQLTGGHRDVSATSCPGGSLYSKIPAINQLAGDDMLTEHETEELKKLVASLDSVGSNGNFAGPAVKLIRKERSTPLHDHDVSDGHDHDGRYVKNVKVSK